MSMPSYRVEEWYRCILRIAGTRPFVCVGGFPEALERKFTTTGMRCRRLSSLDRIDSTCNAIVWFIRDMSEDDALTLLPRLARLHRPTRLYFELAPPVSGRRAEIESAFFREGYRKSADYHRHVEFAESCLHNPAYSLESVPQASPEADPNRDSLRDSGRRADAHTMRYHWAAGYIRLHDVVLDAACGLGYGSRILAENSHCQKVTGLDNSDYAIRYADLAYGEKGRVEFLVRDVGDLSHLEDRSVHDIVSFETLEHLPDPSVFLRECRRVLIPGGRFICSVPNRRTDESGNDPNPYHFHVYTREKLLRQLSEFFMVEHLFAEKAGGGFRRFNREERALNEVDPAAPEEEAEWWLAVAMKDPVGVGKEHFRVHFNPELQMPDTNIGAFGRDYDNPWLVFSCVIPGRSGTASPRVQTGIATRELAVAEPGSSDRGAALCVQGYRTLDGGDPAALRALIPGIEDYLSREAANAHQFRWKISLLFLLGRIYLEIGDRERARELFRRCADEDCLRFGPTLGTKTVEAQFLHGWLLYLEGREPDALASWKRGVSETERILKTSDWRELRGREDLPFDWGFAEAMVLLQNARKCAFAVFAIESGSYSREELAHAIWFDGAFNPNVNTPHSSYLKDRLLHSEVEGRKQAILNENLRQYSRLLQADIEKKKKILERLERKIRSV